MRELGKQVKVRLNKEDVECRLWYRMMMQGSKWELVKNLERTVGNEGLSNGDKLILEYRCREVWPRDCLRNDELQWEVKDKVDIYVESRKSWEEGVIVENRPGCLCIKVLGANFNITKNSSIIAPHRTHTVHSIRSVLTPEVVKKLVKEFKPLPNLGNT
eukprot:TRINITY_DN4012_c0_g1_i1.p3 TRINITY_DN4012_c0_g1~~TRINITY_DN4012_c0_g1_i1.p3  ORF type:complete len:159 (+),score=45.15 TRINITY_DN4012_c0_g1_i1:393-869(+)